MSVRKSSGEEMAIEKRPLGVSIVGFGAAILSGLAFIAGLMRFVYFYVYMDVPLPSSFVGLSNLIVSPIMTLVLLAGSVGILMGRNWGRVLFIVWSLFSVGINLLSMMMNREMVEAFSVGKEVYILLVILFLVYGIAIYILLSPRANRFFRSSGETEGREEWLQLTGKTPEGRPVELEVAIPDLQNEAEGLTIGRSSEYAEAVISDSSVSRTHVRVHWLEGGQGQKGKVCLTDLGSTNGTSINGEPLTPGEPAGLDPGARIQLGQVSLQAEQKRY